VLGASYWVLAVHRNTPSTQYPTPAVKNSVLLARVAKVLK